jgi:hypothetical protein
MTIAGQRAYVDESGVHIGTQGSPANAAASAIANKALAGFGIETYVSQPQTSVEGASATYVAGSLLIIWEPPQNDHHNIFTITFGGARVSVASSPAFDIEGTDLTGDTSGGVSFDSGVTPGASSTGDVGGLPVSTPSGPAPAAAQSLPATRTGRSRPAGTFAGIALGWVLLAVVGSALACAGSRRLADDVLDRPNACPLQ